MLSQTVRRARKNVVGTSAQVIREEFGMLFAKVTGLVLVRPKSAGQRAHQSIAQA
jgi:hypothetical protein